jgi:NitT/TauT family transport system permease protein
MADQLRDTIPTFGDTKDEHADAGVADMSALTSANLASSGRDALILIVVAVIVIGGIQAIVNIFDIKPYVLPKPTEVGEALFTQFHLFRPHLWITLKVLFIGYVIGAAVGLTLAALVTQFPFVEKVITPYILMLVTTPMIALVPLLALNFGFGSSTPRIIATALATGPMVMINSATGFRRTDLAKIALAKSYGASTMQIFAKVRFPLALPMIIVGLMVGAIFGMLTAVGAEMVGGSEGLGNRLMYYSSRIQMANFWAVIMMLAAMGILIYVFFFWVGKRWASWQA